MANVVNPRGFQPIHGNEGGPPPVNYYKANTSTNIYRNDVVEINSSGVLVTITATTGSTKIVGVAAHHIIAAADTNAQDIAVYDDPDQVFTAQDDGGATPAQAQAGGTCEIVVTTGNTTTYQSKHSIKLSTVGTSSSAPLILRGFLNIPSSDNSLVNAMWLVQLNLHLFSKGNAGV